MNPKHIVSILLEEEREYPTEAAIRLPDGSIFKAYTHHDAMLDAMKAGKFPGVEFDEDLASCPMEDGFVTNLGRFVDRDEAYKLAISSKEIEPSDVELMSGGKPYLDSVDYYDRQLQGPSESVDPYDIVFKNPDFNANDFTFGVIRKAQRWCNEIDGVWHKSSQGPIAEIVPMDNGMWWIRGIDYKRFKPPPYEEYSSLRFKTKEQAAYYIWKYKKAVLPVVGEAGLRYRNIAPVQFMTLLPGAPYNAWFVAVEPFQGLDDNVYQPGDRIALSTLNQWGYAVPPQEYQRFISSGGYAKRRKYAGGGE